MKFHRTLTALFFALALTLCFAPTAFAGDEAPAQSGFTLDLSWLTDGIANLWDAVTSEPDPAPAASNGTPTDETNGCVVPIGGCASSESQTASGSDGDVPTDETNGYVVPIG